MVPQILASGGLGGIPWVPIIVGPVVFWYLLNVKRLEHQRIMAAIEKGTPLSELRPVEKKGPDWIGSLTVGVAFLLMGIGMAIVASISIVSDWPDKDVGFGLFIASVVLLSIGIAGIIRSILLQKAEKALSADKSALDANKGQ